MRQVSRSWRIKIRCTSVPREFFENGLKSIEAALTMPVPLIPTYELVPGRLLIHCNGLAGKGVKMLEDLAKGRRRRQFLDKKGQSKWCGIRKHLKYVDKFKELLLLLAHFTNQPSRGGKITGLRLVNGINRDQNGLIIDGEFACHTVSQIPFPFRLTQGHSTLPARADWAANGDVHGLCPAIDGPVGS